MATHQVTTACHFALDVQAATFAETASNFADVSILQSCKDVSKESLQDLQSTSLHLCAHKAFGHRHLAHIDTRL